MNAEQANWKHIKNFAKSEWKHNRSELSLLSFKQIELADRVRDHLGVKMTPSPVDGAFARTYGSKGSQHYAGDGKLANAGDYFIPSLTPKQLMVKLFNMKDKPRGIGIYLDTQLGGEKCTMLHIDSREKPLFWIRDEDGYHYDEKEIARRIG